MEIVKDLFGNYKLPPTRKRMTERSLIIESIYLEIEKGWDKKYGKLTPQYIVFKVGHIKTKELCEFYSMCKQSKSGFGKCFFGALKVNKKGISDKFKI